MRVGVLSDLFLLSVYCLSPYFQGSAWGSGCVIPAWANGEREAAFENAAAQVPTSTQTDFIRLHKLSDAI